MKTPIGFLITFKQNKSFISPTKTKQCFYLEIKEQKKNLYWKIKEKKIVLHKFIQRNC